MYTEPQSVTISGTANSLKRIDGPSGMKGAFSLPDGTVTLKISHAIGKRRRQSVRLEVAKIAADPLTAVNTSVGMTAYLVVDTPPAGYSIADAKAVVLALATWLSASTGANTEFLLGGES